MNKYKIITLAIALSLGSCVNPVGSKLSDASNDNDFDLVDSFVWRDDSHKSCHFNFFYKMSAFLTSKVSSGLIDGIALLNPQNIINDNVARGFDVKLDLEKSSNVSSKEVVWNTLRVYEHFTIYDENIGNIGKKGDLDGIYPYSMSFECVFFPIAATNDKREYSVENVSDKEVQITIQNGGTISGYINVKLGSLDKTNVALEYIKKNLFYVNENALFFSEGKNMYQLCDGIEISENYIKHDSEIVSYIDDSSNSWIVKTYVSLDSGSQRPKITSLEQKDDGLEVHISSEPFETSYIKNGECFWIVLKVATGDEIGYADNVNVIMD